MTEEGDAEDESEQDAEDDPNQYGGGTEDIDAVEQTERVTDAEEGDEEDGEDETE